MTQRTMATGRRALSVDEAAIQIGIGRSLAWALVREGKLRTIRAGHRVLVPVEAIDDFLAGQSQPDAE